MSMNPFRLRLFKYGYSGCKNNSDLFRYIFCLVDNWYHVYFEMKLEDQVNSLIPHEVCKICIEYLP